MSVSIFDGTALRSISVSAAAAMSFAIFDGTTLRNVLSSFKSPTPVSFPVIAGNDDLYIRIGSTNYSPASTAMFVGSRTTVDNDYASYLRIPVANNGRLFSELFLDLRFTAEVSTSAGLNYEIVFEQVDNAAFPADNAAVQAKTFGTAVTGTIVAGQTLPVNISTPNLAALANAVIQRPGWTSGNYVGVFMRDSIRGNTAPTRKNFQAFDAGSLVPRLYGVLT